MTLSQYVKTNAPGWNVRKLAERIGKPEQTLRNWWRDSPEIIRLMVAGLE